MNNQEQPKNDESWHPPCKAMCKTCDWEGDWKQEYEAKKEEKAHKQANPNHDTYIHYIEVPAS